jgi:hypothetical protein
MAESGGISGNLTSVNVPTDFHTPTDKEAKVDKNNHKILFYDANEKPIIGYDENKHQWKYGET